MEVIRLVGTEEENGIAATTKTKQLEENGYREGSAQIQNAMAIIHVHSRSRCAWNGNRRTVQGAR